MQIRNREKGNWLTVITILFFSQIATAQINPKATVETKALYESLKEIGQKGTLFGHQDAPAYGLNENGSRWIDETDRSDVKTLIGQYPAVIGFDLGHIELGKSANLDEVPFDKMRGYIEDQIQ